MGKIYPILGVFMGKKCSIFGHREFKVDNEFLSILQNCIENLIQNENVDVFIFGSKSMIYIYCWHIIEKLKQKYPFVKTIVVNCFGELKNNSIMRFDETINFKNSSNKYLYIERNHFMIDMSDMVLFYFNPCYSPKTKTRSGTHLAYNYALKNNKKIYNIFNLLNQEDNLS